MGFVTPLALLLLGALTLPWLVHRMRQRDLPIVTLPTIALLQRALVVTQRRRALQDLLLMLTRMALIALLAFGLATPFVWGGVSLGNGQPQSVVLVLDDSMSMQRAEQGQLLWNAAKTRALELLEQLPATSQAGVIVAGRPPRTLVALGAPSAASTALSSFDPSPARGTELPAAVDLAAAMLAAAQHEQRRVLVLSDFMGSGPPLGNKHTTVRIEHERFGEGRARDNVAIVDAAARRDADVQGGFRLNVQVRGFHSARRKFPLRVRIAETTVHEREITLGQNDQADLELTLTPEQAFEQTTALVELVLEDGLALDNQRAVLLRDPRTLRVLLVNGDPRPTHSSDELHFLARALPLRETSTTPLTLETVDVLGLDRTPFDDVDLIWLANVAAPSADTATRLTNFVNAGGSLVLSAGDRIEPAAINARLGALLPARIESVHAGAVDLATEGVAADPWGIAVESVGHAITQKRLVTEPTGHVSLRYVDGVAALLHRAVGRGRVVLWTTSIDGDWTDLPYRPGFLALTLGVLDALTPPPDSARVLEPGHPVRLPLGNDSIEATLIDPRGQPQRLRLDVPTVAASAEQTLWPGAYSVQITDDNGAMRALPRVAFVVAPPIEESDLTPMVLPEQHTENNETQMQNARVQRPVDRYVFAWLLPLFLLEALLRVQRRRAAV